MAQYKPLDYNSRNFHIFQQQESGMLMSVVEFPGIQPRNYTYSFFPVSGLMPSGEANFFDEQQDVLGLKGETYKGFNFQFRPKADKNLALTDGATFPQTSGMLAKKVSPAYSGELNFQYIHYTPHPNAGSGVDDPIPANVTFDPDSSIVKYTPTPPSGTYGPPPSEEEITTTLPPEGGG